MGTPESQTTAFELRIAVLRLARRIRSEKTYDTLTASQRSALVRIEENGPISPKELAHLEIVQPSAATRTIAQLEEFGYLARTRNPTDGRGWLVQVTNQGRTAIQDFRGRREAQLVKWLSTLSTEQRAILAQALPLFDRLSGG